MSRVLGIDLGTTNSVVSYFEKDKGKIILTTEGERLLPSVIGFTKGGERLVGSPAKSQIVTNPSNTVHSVKRLMGKKFSEIRNEVNKFAYKIVKGPNDSIKILIDDFSFSPEELSAMILQKLKEIAENFFKEEVKDTVITVPAYFNDSQRQATKNAGEIAGLNVIRIINEPTAASLSFSLSLNKEKAKILVYDFGGGTIDISILDVENDIIKVLSTAGNTALGGNDLDEILSDLFISEIKDEYGINLDNNKMAIQRLSDAAENAKKELSGMDACEINLPFIADSKNGPIHFLKYLTRDEFEHLIDEKINSTIDICKLALKNARLSPSDIDEILLVGGTTRIPLIQKKVREFFGKEPNKKINPDEIVSLGASIQGSIIKGKSKDILLLDVIPLSLGVKTFGGTFTKIIKANTVIPIKKSMVFSTAEDNQGEVEINIYQGEREIAENNKLLGKFILMGISPAPKGIPRIEVSFSVDINGILTVTAMDLSTKLSKEISVTQSGLLNEDEIEQLKLEAEKFKEVDRKQKELVDIRNKILNYAYVLDKQLDYIVVNEKIKTVCRNLIHRAKEDMEKDNPKELTALMDELKNMKNDFDEILKTDDNYSQKASNKDIDTKEFNVFRKKDDTRPLNDLVE